MAKFKRNKYLTLNKIYAQCDGVQIHAIFLFVFYFFFLVGRRIFWQIQLNARRSLCAAAIRNCVRMGKILLVKHLFLFYLSNYVCISLMLCECCVKRMQQK